MSGHTRRMFERMFPGIKEDEDRHYKTTLANGRLAADKELQDRHNQLTSNIKQKIIWTITYDFENGTEIYTPTKTEE